MIKRNKQSRTGILPVYTRSALRMLADWKPVLLCSLIATLTGCSDTASEQSVYSAPVYSKQVLNQSTIAIISLSETNITTSGKIQLMIEIHASQDAKVTFPDIRYSAEPFTVGDGYTEPQQTLPNGHILHRRAWTLLPALPGTYDFPALEIYAGNTLLQSEAVKLNVTSLLPEGIDDFEIRDIAPAAALLPEQEKKQKTALISISIITVLSLLYWAFKHFSRKEIITLTPYEEISLALKNLPQDELERIHALTEILLTFIEKQLHVPTSGKTLSEIIPSLPKDVLMGRREPLEMMLTTSEQIRFSNKVPFGFVVELQEYVRTFAEQTKEEPCD